jgi:hypothetical protein
MGERILALSMLALGVMATIVGCINKFWPGKNPRGDGVGRMVLRLIGVVFLVIGIAYVTLLLRLPPWYPN